MTPHRPNLMIRMLKRAARARREHGMALLFTLCILSMALITAMIFSSNATTGRKVAGAYVDTSSARILADGAVSRAILTLMQSDNASYICSNYRTNAPSGNADDYASDWIWKMEKSGLFTFNNGPLRFNNSVHYDREDTRCPSWEYVYAPRYGSSTDQLYGRYAYVAIGMNDQLNANAIGKRDYGDFDEALFKKRLGRWTCEPQFVFRSSRNRWDNKYSSVITPKKIEENYKKTDEEKGWTDLDVFVNDMTGGGSSGADKQLKMMVDQYFDVSDDAEYNKFNPNGKAIGDLTKHELTNGDLFRFPVIRNDWDSISIEAVKNGIPWFNSNYATVNQTVANLINYNASINRPPVTDKNNWVTETPTYTGNKRTPYINEVYADVSVGGNLGIRLSEHYLADPQDPTSWKWRVWYTDCTYDHEIVLHVETVNMYATTGGSDGTISVQPPKLVGEISYEYSNGENSWVKQTVPFNAETSWENSDDGNYGNRAGYYVYVFRLKSGSIGSLTTPKHENYDRPMGHEIDFYKYVRVRNVKVSLDRVVLYDYAGRNADLALMPAKLQNGNTFSLNGGVSVAGAGDFSRHFYFDAQVNDPRCNLARTDWGTPAFSEEESGLSSTLEEVNNTISLGTYHDNEKTSNPVYAGNDSISTAYIRHGQMISLWELGAIHRGAPWQTINLKCGASNDAHAIRMDRYDYGDGHLLDQVALTRSTGNADDAVVGMINLNCVANFGGSSAPFVFKSLFTDFPIYQTYANMNNGDPVGTIKGNTVDSDDRGGNSADAYAKDLSEAVTFAISQGNFRRRTAVFPTAFPAAGSQMERIIPRNVPDAQSEEIFSRVVNLLKWNHQKTRRATVLVLAQTIRDVGGVPLDANLPDNDIDLLHNTGFLAYDLTDAEKRNTLLDASKVRADIKSNGNSTQYKRYDNLFDQITGEAKIIVRLEWDESANENKGAWKITRREYAE